MSQIVRRLARLAVVAVVATGCAAGPGVPSAPATSAPSVADPAPTPVATDGRTLPPTGGRQAGGGSTGNVDRQFPELATSLHDEVVTIELRDPSAKAWAITVAGTGTDEHDRLEILVEVADVGFGAQVRSIVDDRLVETSDLSGMIGETTAAAGGCHPTLDLCFGSGTIDPDLENGQIRLRLDAGIPDSFAVTGATAGWDEEPFILGEWHATETVPVG